MNKKLFMSFDEYQNMPPNKVPYTYVVSNEKQCLYYFGSEHTYNPNHSEFIELKSFFEEFISKTQGKDRIVLVEGGGIPPLAENKEQAISKFSEMGYIVYLSHSFNITCISPEPSTASLYNELAKHFSKEEIMYSFFLRRCAQWTRTTRDAVDFEKYIQPSFNNDKKSTNWIDEDFSLANMKIIHQRIFGTDFNIADSSFFKKMSDPTRNDSITNKIIKFMTNYRDEYIVDEIEKYWKEGKSVFVIFGATHAVMQEPALQTLVR